MDNTCPNCDGPPPRALFTHVCDSELLYQVTHCGCFYSSEHGVTPRHTFPGDCLCGMPTGRDVPTEVLGLRLQVRVLRGQSRHGVRWGVALQQMLQALAQPPDAPSVTVEVEGPPGEPARVPTPPLPVLLFCPMCKKQHIDKLEPDGIDWRTRPHRKHLYLGCGHVWKPCALHTVGVETLPDEPTPPASPVSQDAPETTVRTKTMRACCPSIAPDGHTIHCTAKGAKCPGCGRVRGDVTKQKCYLC